MSNIIKTILIGSYGVAYCPTCKCDIHGRGMISICPYCNQLLSWDRIHKHTKDSTELSGGHLW